MEDGGGDRLNTDVLIEIFKKFGIVKSSTSGAADFANSLHRASSELWRTLDLSMLRSTHITIGPEPYVYVASESDRELSALLYVSLSLSQENIRTLIFHYDLFLSNDLFTYTAQSCPRLRRLVLPAWNRIRKRSMCDALRGWEKLESLTMPSIREPDDMYTEIFEHCPNLRQLKVMGPFSISLALSIARSLPKLKVLSLRCSMVCQKALILILKDLKELEVLNISHCVLVEAIPSSDDPSYRVLTEIDTYIPTRAASLREFHTCMNDLCVMCQRTRMDEGLPRWNMYEQGIWKADEVNSLAL